MNNLGKFFISLLSLSAIAQTNPFLTTRLVSTGGAGVASILVNESSILNPASIAFIPITNFYYQKSTAKLDQKVNLRSIDSNKGQAEIYQISDTSSPLKGTFSYQNQARNGFSRKKLVSSLASHIGPKTSIGFIYSYNFLNTPFLNKQDTFHQGTIGLTHVFNNRTSFGIVVEDPFLSNSEESQIKTGFQFALFQNTLFIQDFSKSLKEQKNKGITSRSAIQINAFADFYIRAGLFSDILLNTKGTAYGLSWVGPKLSFDLAIMKSEFVKNTLLNFKGEKDVESSLAVSIRF